MDNDQKTARIKAAWSKFQAKLADLSSRLNQTRKTNAQTQDLRRLEEIKGKIKGL